MALALLLVDICLLGSDIVGSLLISFVVELVFSCLGARSVLILSDVGLMMLIVGAGSVLSIFGVESVWQGFGVGHVLCVGVGRLVLLLPSVLESGLVVVCIGL